jgi:hypothetical protein
MKQKLMSSLEGILPKLGKLLDIFEPSTAAIKVMLQKKFYSTKLF